MIVVSDGTVVPQFLTEEDVLLTEKNIPEATLSYGESTHLRDVGYRDWLRAMLSRYDHDRLVAVGWRQAWAALPGWEKPAGIIWTEECFESDEHRLLLLSTPYHVARWNWQSMPETTKVIPETSTLVSTPSGADPPASVLLVADTKEQLISIANIHDRLPPQRWLLSSSYAVRLLSRDRLSEREFDSKDEMHWQLLLASVDMLVCAVPCHSLLRMAIRMGRTVVCPHIIDTVAMTEKGGWFTTSTSPTALRERFLTAWSPRRLRELEAAWVEGFLQQGDIMSRKALMKFPTGR